MVVRKNQVRKEILERPCEKCGNSIPYDDGCIATFYRGRFVILHKKCADFIDNPNQPPQDLPTRLRGLAREMREVDKLIASDPEIGNLHHMVDGKVYYAAIPGRLEELADELEKEEHYNAN